MGGIGADAKTSISLISIRYSAPLPLPPLICNALGASIFLGGADIFSAPDEIFLSLSPLKMESACGKKNPGHASALERSKIFLVNNINQTFLVIDVNTFKKTELSASLFVWGGVVQFFNTVVWCNMVHIEDIS